ncbi:alpha/beta fold hydrolase [Nocardia bovistercoris]|uniref:Alpha/beta hydrolase n=1 Tax=Nocardia bovistercoris TaxID=2785916 RepID=A0A931ICT2_9NOCA|nr:alpha/beta hydrolase [Nocardia bovistercoris]MBH0777782.1 alpha/beta hydrolase [Nocardia bovistercoris]
MTRTPTTPVTEHTLTVPDGTLHYEVRGDGPLIVLVGAPMTADAFAPMAEMLASGRTVLTTDPRGHGRSPLHDPSRDSTPPLRAADLAALITHLDVGPAIVFGSSGGAVSALALAQEQPDLVTTVVTHEPPSIALLEDREHLRAGTDNLIATYLSGDVLGGWRGFFAQACIDIPEPVLAQMFGGDRDPAQVASEKYWFEHEMRATTTWEPDIAALTAAPTRVIVGIGAESAGQICDRTSRALAHHLGLDPYVFPGDHTGFVDKTPEFVTRLREVLRIA